MRLLHQTKKEFKYKNLIGKRLIEDSAGEYELEYGDEKHMIGNISYSTAITSTKHNARVTKLGKPVSYDFIIIIEGVCDMTEHSLVYIDDKVFEVKYIDIFQHFSHIGVLEKRDA